MRIVIIKSFSQLCCFRFRFRNHSLYIDYPCFFLQFSSILLEAFVSFIILQIFVDSDNWGFCLLSQCPFYLLEDFHHFLVLVYNYPDASVSGLGVDPQFIDTPSWNLILLAQGGVWQLVSRDENVCSWPAVFKILN